MAENLLHINFFSLIHQHAETPALVAPTESVSWIELGARLSARSRRLLELGLKPGDKCAICAPPSLDYVEALLAMWATGIIAVPLNTRLPVEQINDKLAAISCKMILGAANQFAIAQQFRFEELASEPLENVKSDSLFFGLNSPATIIFTSGSTAAGKACLHTFGSHYFNALGSNENIALKPGDRWLLSLPLYHVAGIAILFRCLLSGAAIAIPAPDQPLAQTIETLAPSHVSLVPAQMMTLLGDQSVSQKLRQMQAILLGGSAIPAPLLDKAVDLKLPIFTSYGSTEMASQITTTQPNDPLEKLLTSGRLLRHRELKISEDGEILVRGETLFAGYVSGDNIDPARDTDGWFHTGDLGRLDENGYLNVTGRRDNMFISGGENIYPEEIERELLKITGVQQAIVVPVPHACFGQRPIAFVDVQPHLVLASLAAELENKLPRYKIPDHFFPWPAEGQTGIKPSRAQLRILGEELIRRHSQV